MEYFVKTSVLNAIHETNTQILKGYCLYLNFGIATAPKCLLISEIPKSVNQDYLIDKVNYHLSNSKLGTIRQFLMDEEEGTALLYVNCVIFVCIKYIL